MLQRISGNYLLNPKLARAFNKVEDEVYWAIEHFPPMRSAHEGWAIIKEELDELWEAIRDNKNTPVEQQLKEAKQVAAMAIRFMVDIGEENYRNELGRESGKDSGPAVGDFAD